MKLESSLLAIDLESTEKRILKFLQARLLESGRKGFVVGLSGGVDSSTTATLCVKAVSPDNVLGLIMPHRESNPQDREHAMLLVESLKIPYRLVDITSAVEAVKANITDLAPSGNLGKGEEQRRQNAIGNVKARIRMVNLYLAANTRGSLVVGSGDKSEILVGYFTKYGDGGADIFPIADLYKTQVRALARHIGVPETIVSKPSSPGLWRGQTAETEIGFKYEQLDLILYGLERFMRPEEIADQLGMQVEAVTKVENMLKRAEHKRRGGIVLKLGYRTPTMDWRMPI
ncbi:MAG: NAD+ synthase [Promethearchaeati archaeon SRVP18_Atabeyarchaeia-1]